MIGPYRPLLLLLLLIATVSAQKRLKPLEKNWWIVVIGIVAMVITAVGLTVLGYFCSYSARKEKSERSIKKKRGNTLENP
uniref:Uncharacterized protein n=1 Tax=Panagrellus redivivus TaxID=6233 RepID=A0A7E4UXP4_PANRE